MPSSEASSSSDAAPSSAKPAYELAKAEARIAELERLVGRQQADLRFFSRSLAALGRDQPRQRRAHLYAIIQEMIAVEPQGFPQNDAAIARLCALGGVSRAGYYRHFAPHPPKRDDADLRDLIQKIALDNRCYGYRRIAKELRRQGPIVDDKRVRRLTREDNLLSQRAKPFVPATTLSRHGFAIVPNLTRGLLPTGVDQIWVADITYVRLAEGFVDLAAILDAPGSQPGGHRLGDRRPSRGESGDRGSRHGACRPKPSARQPHPPFRSRRAIRLRRISRATREA